MGLAVIGHLETEEECTAAGTALMEVVSGKFQTNDGSKDNPLSTTPSLAKKPPLVMELPNTPTIDFTKKAFETHKLTGEPVLDSTARKNKSRAVTRIETAIVKAGTPAQQALAVATALWKPDNQPVGKALGLVVNNNQTRRVADRFFQNIWDALHHPAVLKKQTKESLSFQQTLLWAIAPTAPPDNAPIQVVKKDVRKQVLEAAATLGMRKTAGFVKRFQAATVVRREIFANKKDPTLAIINKRGHYSRYTPEFIVELRQWLVEHCQKIIQSPNAKDFVMVRCPITGVKSLLRKHFFLFSVRELLNDVIKNFPGARNELGDVIISDTALRSIIPKNITRMNDSNKKMCGCEICENAYHLMIALNSWRGRKRSIWENDVRKHVTTEGVLLTLR